MGKIFGVELFYASYRSHLTVNTEKQSQIIGLNQTKKNHMMRHVI